MAEESDSEKTEQPTGKKLNQARIEGNLPVSREAASWVSLLGILVVITWLAPPMAGKLIDNLRVFIESPHLFVLDDKGLQTVVSSAITKVLMSTILIFIVLYAAIIAGYMMQTGLFASSKLLAPKLTNLSLINGIKKLFSVNSLVELIKSFGKLIVLGTAVSFAMWPIILGLPAFTGSPLMDATVFMHDKAIHLIVIMLLVFTAIALGDLAYQRFSYIKKLKMTKQEVKDEHKEMDGDPMIKNRLRQIRFEKARKRMMANVPKADVVITNPTHYAVALKYDSKTMTAPTVLAKGIDNVALRIRNLAEEHKISLVSNPPLARALYDTVELDKEIPADHYRAVAEVISYVYKLKKVKT